MTSCTTEQSTVPITPTSFEDCVQIGGNVAESYPRQCFYGEYSFTELIEEEQIEETSLETSCLSDGGSWIASAQECEGIGKDMCVALGGNFNECASACRNNPDAVVCTLQCIQVCEFAVKIPETCTSWFDGCNTCMVEGGELGGCTKMYCAPENMEEASCLAYEDTNLENSGAYDAVDQAKCLEKGGKYEQYGMLQWFQCNLPTNDEGNACQSSDDCEGLCLSKDGEGACSPWTVNFGCIPIMLDGEETTICID